MADDGGLAHGKHGTHGRIFGRRERRGRRGLTLTKSIRWLWNRHAPIHRHRSSWRT